MRVSRMLCLFLLLGTLTTLRCAADITGKSDVGPGWTFNFKSEGNKLTGAMVSAEGKELPIKDAKLDGDPFLSPWIPSGKASRSSWW